MPVTLAVIAAGAAVTAAGISAYSAHQQGKFQSDMAKYQAKLATTAAIATQEGARGRQAASADAKPRLRPRAVRRQRPADRPSPHLRTKPMGAGPDGRLAREQFNIRRNAELAAWGYSTQGQMDAQGQMAYAAGRLGTASSLIGGVGSSIQNAAAGYSLGSALTKTA